VEPKTCFEVLQIYLWHIELNPCTVRNLSALPTLLFLCYAAKQTFVPHGISPKSRQYSTVYVKPIVRHFIFLFCVYIVCYYLTTWKKLLES